MRFQMALRTLPGLRPGGILVKTMSTFFSMFHFMELPSPLWKAEFKCDGLVNLFGGSSRTVQYLINGCCWLFFNQGHSKSWEQRTEQKYLIWLEKEHI